MKIYSRTGSIQVCLRLFFCNGVGETGDPYLIKWFRDHGYTVEEPEAKTAGKTTKKAGN